MRLVRFESSIYDMRLCERLNAVGCSWSLCLIINCRSCWLRMLRSQRHRNAVSTMFCRCACTALYRQRNAQCGLALFQWQRAWHMPPTQLRHYCDGNLGMVHDLVGHLFWQCQVWIALGFSMFRHLWIALVFPWGCTPECSQCSAPVVLTRGAGEFKREPAMYRNKR